MRTFPLTLHTAGIQGDTMSNGPGIRVAIYTQGCIAMPCAKICQNPDLQPLDPTIGRHLTPEEIVTAVNEFSLSKKRVTWLGGEPTIQPRGCYEATLKLKEDMPERHFVLYTGYTMEQLVRRINNGELYLKEFILEMDMIIDGPFNDNLEDLSLEFRGSTNQRVLYKDDILKFIKGEK